MLLLVLLLLVMTGIEFDLEAFKQQLMRLAMPHQQITFSQVWGFGEIGLALTSCLQAMLNNRSAQLHDTWGSSHSHLAAALQL